MSTGSYLKKQSASRHPMALIRYIFMLAQFCYIPPILLFDEEM